MGFRTIEHKITAGQQFTGAAPAGAHSVVDGVETFAASNAGGLFDFGQGSGGIEIKQVFIKLGAQASWSLSVIDSDATATVVESGTNEATFAKINWGLILFKGEKLKLVTVGASGAMKARVTTRKVG